MRKHTFIKRAVATILALTMMVGMGTTVFAEEGEKICISETTYEEITDIDALIKLALKQNPSQFTSRTANSDIPIFVEQVLSKKVYSDGSEEYIRANAGIVILDKNGKSIPYPIITSETHQTDYGYVMLGMYTTSILNENSLAGNFIHRLDKSVTVVKHVGSAAYGPVSCTMLHFADVYEEYKTFSCIATGTQAYTLNSTDKNFYGASGVMYSNLWSQSVVTFSDGNEVCARAFMVGDADFDPTP